jgi:hypothetical protein
MVIGSFALGAAAVQVVHAAGTPPAYVIGEINVKDQDGYKNLSTCGTEGYWAAGGKYVAGGCLFGVGCHSTLWRASVVLSMRPRGQATACRVEKAGMTLAKLSDTDSKDAAARARSSTR